MKLVKRSVASLLLMFCAVVGVQAAERINTLEKSGLFGYEANGIAIRGYDTVAYFGNLVHRSIWICSRLILKNMHRSTEGIVRTA